MKLYYITLRSKHSSSRVKIHIVAVDIMQAEKKALYYAQVKVNGVGWEVSEIEIVAKEVIFSEETQATYNLIFE